MSRKNAAAILTITRNGEMIKSLPIEGDAMLGRGEGCLIRLDDRAISRQHAMFRVVDGGVQVEKRSEFAPLSVNGAEQTRALVREADVIAIGPYLVRVSMGKAAPSLDLPEIPSAPAAMSAPAARGRTGGIAVAAPMAAAPAAIASSSGDGLEEIPMMPATGDEAAATAGEELSVDEPNAPAGDALPDFNLELGGDAASPEALAASQPAELNVEGWPSTRRLYGDAATAVAASTSTVVAFPFIAARRASTSATISAFCRWSRFSACSSTTLCAPSSTSSTTSSPRCAGRQCMKSASG